MSRVASRYAKALVDLAVEQGKLEDIYSDITSFQEVMKNRDFELMLKSPIIKSDRKGKVLDAIFGGKIDKMTSKFFEIVLRKGREAALPSIADAFIEQYRNMKNVSSVTLTSATALSADAADCPYLHGSFQETPLPEAFFGQKNRALSTVSIGGALGFDLAPLCNIILMLSECFCKHVPPCAISNKINIIRRHWMQHRLNRFPPRMGYGRWW